MATWNAIGFAPEFTEKWIGSWLFAWAVAFPTVLVVAPMVRRLTSVLVAPDPEMIARLRSDGR